MEVCNDSVNDNLINGESAIVQNVSEIPMVIFLQTPQETHSSETHELLMPVVENDEQNNENINSDDVSPVALIHDALGNVTTLDATQQGNIPVTWLGCGNNSQEQLLYVTYVGDAASGGGVQPMLLQVAPSGDNEEYFSQEKLGEEEEEEEEEEDDPEQANNAKTPKKEHTNTWQTIADDVHIETKLQVLDAMLPPLPKVAPYRRSDDDDGEALYKCDLCHAAFSKAQQYYGHLHSHTGERLWKCDICSLIFATHSLLRRHERIHANLRPFICNLCGLKFDRESQLQYHERRIHLEERSHQCQFCMKSFFKRSDLRNHLNIHLGIRKNICETCGRQFNHRSNLKRHSRIHTGIKPYVCNICGLRFVQVNALNAHKVQQHPALGPEGYPSFECGHCGKVLRSLPLLKRHIKILHGLEVRQEPVVGHSKIRQYYCQICGVSFPFAALLQQHEIESHANQDNFLCRNCGQSFNKSEDLKSHSCGANHVAKDSEDLLKCDPKNRGESDTALQLETLIDQTLLDCLNTPSNNDLATTNEGNDLNKKDNESEMVIYIRTEGQDEPTAVTIKYGNNFNQETPNIEINENSQLPEINFPIPTDNVNDDNSRFSLLSVASSTSKSLSDNLVVSKEEMDAIDAQKAEELVDSILEREPIKLDNDPLELPVVVKQKKLFECKECGKVFNKKSNYTQHLGLHNVDQRKYKCSHCGSTYAWKSSLNKHLQSAHGVNVDPSKIQCTQCTKHFLNGTVYHEHLKRDHLKERNHICPDCCKAFYKKADLMVHLRIHTKEKPYMCGTCGKAFSHVSHIIRHERIHNGIRPYTCEVCGKGFTQSTTLKNHRKRHLEPKIPKIKATKTPRTSKAKTQGKITSQQPEVILGIQSDHPSTVDLQIWNAA